MGGSELAAIGELLSSWPEGAQLPADLQEKIRLTLDIVLVVLASNSADLPAFLVANNHVARAKARLGGRMERLCREICLDQADRDQLVRLASRLASALEELPPPQPSSPRPIP